MKNTAKLNLQFFILSGIFNTIMLNLYNPFIVKFLQRLGGDEFHISLLNSLPGFVGVLSSLPGAIYIVKRSHASPKTHMIRFLWASRLLLIGFALVVYTSPQIAPWLFVILFALKSFPESISQTAFQGFTGDLFDDNYRSTAISLRSKLSTPISVVITLLTGYMLRVLPQNDNDRMLLYQIFIVAAMLFGILEIFSLSAIKEPSVEITSGMKPFKEILADIKKQKKFISFTLSSLLFYFGWQMGWPLFSIYQVVNLRADEFWLSIIAVVTAIGSYLGYSYWNRMIKRKGNSFVASVTTMGMAINPVVMAISPNLYWASLVSFIIGFFVAGNVTVLLNALLESTPSENRVIYIGTYNTLINISLMISPIVAHSVLKLTGIFWALIVVAIIRTMGSIVFYINHAKKQI